MKNSQHIQLSYFPGCSLSTSAKENNQSLIRFCHAIEVELIEMTDWNCCGSSSAHSLNSNLAYLLAARNLSLAPPERPLLAACPNCLLRLRHAHYKLKSDKRIQKEYENYFGKAFDNNLKIIHFFELLTKERLNQLKGLSNLPLKGLRFVPYYGCMLAHPPDLKFEKNYYGLMESILEIFGAASVRWPHASKCCGTFLSVVKPNIVTSIVNTIIQHAIDAGADCIVTACAMCHLNLEIRCTLNRKIPILYFSELLSIAAGSYENQDWFSRHLADPLPLLKSKGII